MVSARTVGLLLIAWIAIACAHSSAGSSVAVPAPDPVARNEPARRCVSDRCLARIDRFAPEWSIFDRFGVPDPDSVVWIEEAGRREYVAAAHLTPQDVPAPCRRDEAECYAVWRMHVTGVSRSEGSCSQALIDLQLVLTDSDTGDEFPVGSPRRFAEDFVGLEEFDLEICETYDEGVE